MDTQIQEFIKQLTGEEVEISVNKPQVELFLNNRQPFGNIEIDNNGNVTINIRIKQSINGSERDELDILSDLAYAKQNKLYDAAYTTIMEGK